MKGVGGLAPFDCLTPDEVLSQKEVRDRGKVLNNVESMGGHT